MKRYAAASLPDFLLCLLITLGLGVNVYAGFYLPAALSSSVLPLMCFASALLFLCFAAAYDRRTIVVGIVLALAAIAAAVLWMRRTGTVLTDPEDPENNTPLWLLVSTAITLSVFLLSRTSAGAGVLFVGGALSISVLAVLEYNGAIWGLILFLAAGGAMFFFRRYYKNVLRGGTARTAFLHTALYAAGMAAAAVLLGAVLWLCALRPMNLPVQDIRIVTRIVSVELLEKMGVSTTMQLLDRDTLSQDINEDEQRLSDQKGEDDPSIPTADGAWAAAGEQQEETSLYAARREEHRNDDLTRRLTRYLREWLQKNRILLTVTVSAVLLCAAVLFSLRRRLRHRRALRLSPEARVLWYYRRYLRAFAILGFGRRPSQTPLEYAAAVAERVSFLDDGTARWQDITALFIRVYYGGCAVTDTEEQLLESYYKNFYPRCRRYCGVRHLLKSIRL